MKIDEVPQDDIPTFRGHGTKAIYALDARGRYTKTTTSGWEVEELVLRDVLADFAEKAEAAKARILAGRTSPIEYFLNRRLMDLAALAQAMGIGKWRVKRHLKPRVFNKLNDKLLQRYASLFRIDIATLKQFKEILARDPDSQF
ncbi:hypothetical protein [Desulfatitalea alkaliphila]|uniref:HTH cro/C1-type domain-containing protein n=1 Tax=Desulfatitalea alkaliphila TaxID=2929485 RepID=A0AA41R0V2_9BACT|nr:hypothetical protein [Desulfatitalea alkaliphila]MCJ8500179.1 hypothetical protein [Desulfatitalea alkaliphila]